MGNRPLGISAPVIEYVERILKFVRFSHTVFALPFAIGSMIVASRGLPATRVMLLIVLAMVFARTAAMAFNRMADGEIDKENPRTAARHLLVSKRVGWTLVVFSAAAFILVCRFINSLCFLLSPVALVIIFFYSLTKRFTSFTQVFLGLALGIAPIGAWLAVRGQFAVPPLVLGAGVLFWLVGFDLIYAIQDYEFDGGKIWYPCESASCAVDACRFTHLPGSFRNSWGPGENLLRSVDTGVRCFGLRASSSR